MQSNKQQLSNTERWTLTIITIQLSSSVYSFMSTLGTYWLNEHYQHFHIVSTICYHSHPCLKLTKLLYILEFTRVTKLQWLMFLKYSQYAYKLVPWLSVRTIPCGTILTFCNLSCFMCCFHFEFVCLLFCVSFVVTIKLKVVSVVTIGYQVNEH